MIKKIEKDTSKVSAINRIKLVLDYIGLQNKLEEISEEQKFEQIFISFNDETKFLVSIFFINDLNKDYKKEKLNEEIEMLQFFSVIPAKLNKKNSNDILNLIIRLNNLISIGNFGIKDDSTIYFKYIHIARDRLIDSVLLVEIIQMIEFYLQKFATNIIDIANEKKKFEEAINDCVNNLKLSKK